ncbi:DNA topoisomerase VI subunit B [Ignicoccus islandicus DSM 13165]|uniref:Type 2 DNA topoisomerase 6 subunit B n=1 Tax=Ignicoccus islandicus DSM 13165 TaxID=940295 RepID=A0A0U3DVJ6_9CREN|nr:DNA topoisomerase VI subunit B [Ignicoccus islandicus]ALU11450.1 DNA topoisomerase VI subunit B [Ignicoccus islandicus DSM 13165]
MTAVVRREQYRGMGAAEFFYRNKEIAGFGNPVRAIYQTIRELVENSLDATEVHGILPRITIQVEEVDKEKGVYRVIVDDNGIGIPPDKAPYAFGRVLYSSKYVARQTRGMYGLGVKMAVLYGQMTTGKPTVVITSPMGYSKSYKFKVKVGVKTNEPEVLERSEAFKSAKWHGTRVIIELEADWRRARNKVLEYVKRTAIVSPYADITLVTPEGLLIRYPRTTTKLPRPPKEVKPHPKGVDVEMMKQLIDKTTAKSLVQFLVSEFQSIGPKTAQTLVSMAHLDPSMNPKALTDSQIKALVDAFREYPRFKPPSAEALSPIGEELIKIGLRSVLKPEFVEAVTRRPSAYEGHPFIVEVGIAYGGEIPPSDAPILYRYANKIPLLYDEKSDVAWKVVGESIDWSNYKVTFPAPLVVLTHIASTKIPYKGVGKESVADIPEIEKELKLAVQEVARKLKAYLTKKEKEEEVQKRVVTLMKYVPEVSRSLSILSIDPKRRKPKVEEKVIEEKLKEVIAKKLGLRKEELPEVVVEIE